MNIIKDFLFLFMPFVSDIGRVFHQAHWHVDFHAQTPAWPKRGCAHLVQLQQYALQHIQLPIAPLQTFGDVPRQQVSSNFARQQNLGVPWFQFAANLLDISEKGLNYRFP